jgi:hypothetical protein
LTSPFLGKLGELGRLGELGEKKSFIERGVIVADLV